MNFRKIEGSCNLLFCRFNEKSSNQAYSRLFQVKIEETGQTMANKNLVIFTETIRKRGSSILLFYIEIKIL